MYLIDSNIRAKYKKVSIFHFIIRVPDGLFKLEQLTPIMYIATLPQHYKDEW